MQRLLAIALVIVALLPIFVFATNLPQRRLLRVARARVREHERNGQRGENVQPELPDSVRREQVRIRRAERHPSMNSFVLSMGFQCVMLIAVGAAGRKLFTLRL